ncbi:hypothetical protein QTO34_014768 [Cnephaeus nilssonii]|uniref:Uncharacterized protein n=1 Tax=Cnephaeus nilssonii TaxID=3371016 RepID=A0AA40LUE5_CNENI|nr:hypothetical protein QTO34_014768 [Eptesicus nilssonii]
MAPDPGLTRDIRHRQMGQEGAPRCGTQMDPNSEDGRARLEIYQLAFLQGLWTGANKPTNMAKTCEVFQRPDGSPAPFTDLIGLAAADSN